MSTINDTVREEPIAASTSGGGGDGDSDGVFRFSAVGPTEELARVSLCEADRSGITRVSDNMNEFSVSKLENKEAHDTGAPENELSSRGHANSEKRSDLRNISDVQDYDSILTAFDEFAAKGGGGAVGYGYEIGDLVWGKVKSHPWWPGHIYNELQASTSVRRSKREGHVLVAFFGDNSYGWFDPSELVPFEQNFVEKSRQTFSRAFSKAVEEAVDELSRRRSLGLACRCRNEFNFWPSSINGCFVVDVGDYVPGVFSLNQINKARESFWPKETISFVRQLALTPMTDQHWTVEFIKNKATVLACRKVMFEEFDETYAQAFGREPVRPPRPIAPADVDLSKAPLTGRLVIAEALGKGKVSVKSTKTKDQVEKDKYLFKRREEPIHKKTKKASSGQKPSAHPLLSDGSGFPGRLMDSKCQMHEISVSDITDGKHQPMSDPASMVSDIKASKGSKKIVEGGTKKAKVKKQHAGDLGVEDATLVEKKKIMKRKKETSTEHPAGELSSENAIPIQKKKKLMKKIIHEASADLSVAVSNSRVAVEKVSGMLLDLVPPDNQKEDDGVAHSVEARQEVDFMKLVRDLCGLALDPFHGVERSCPTTTRQIFLKYRSLVYQKSLFLSPSTESETSEAQYSNSVPAASTLLQKPSDKSNMKHMKPSLRPDDPTKGGKKRGPMDRPTTLKKKKKLDDDSAEEINKKKKMVYSEDIIMKKKEMKSLAVEKKISQRGDVKEIAGKNIVPLTLTRAVKPESSKRIEQPVRKAPIPTMLVMKFPAGAALPSGAELRAKFARFGQLDHSATRVFWKSYTCRLVYWQRADAEAALDFARGSSNLFGNTNVRCHTREVEAEAVESEHPVKVQKEEPRITVQQQLKSCLKKQSGDESVGNGSGRGTRVKFILGGEGSSSSNNKSELSNIPEGASSSSYTNSSSQDINTKNLPKFIPQHSIVTTTTPPLPTIHQFQIVPVNMPTTSSEMVARSFNAPHPQPAHQLPKKDISKQLLNLLMRCSDVVNNLTGVLGYVPYHSL